MNVIIKPKILSGTVEAPASKSDLQRIAICSMLSDNETVISHSGSSADIDAVFGCISSMGAKTDKHDGYTVVRPGKRPDRAALFCGESGAVSRFMLPVASALCDNVCIDGLPGLRRRPFTELVSVMRLHGCSIDSDSLPITVHGRLEPGEYHINGNISSQYISGLLMALPCLDSPSRLIVENGMASAGYVEMTLSVMRLFGVNITCDENEFDIQPSNYHSPGRIKAEGDWSGAAYIMSCGSGISVSGLKNPSLQRDCAITELLKTIRNLKGGIAEIDVDNIPDLVPALAAAAATCGGTVDIVNAGRLAVKESDRLSSTADVLSRMGADITSGRDSMRITGIKKLHGAVIPSHGDHRIAMAAAAAAAQSAENSGFDGELVITEAEAVNKSYPDFFRHYEILGGDVRYEF